MNPIPINLRGSCESSLPKSDPQLGSQVLTLNFVFVNVIMLLLICTQILIKWTKGLWRDGSQDQLWKFFTMAELLCLWE